MPHALLLITLLFATSAAADPSTPADKTQPGRDLLFSTTPRAPAIEEKIVVEADGTLSGNVVTDTTPSAAGVPPFDDAAWGFPAFLRNKERPARRESSLKTRTHRRALHL